MTTSPFRFSFSQPRRTRRSATAPAKSVRFAESPLPGKQCQVTKEPSNPDLSSLGPVISKVHKQVKSESVRDANEENRTDAPKAQETLHAKSKSGQGKSAERPKTAPIKQSLTKPEMIDEKVQNPSNSTISSEVPAGPISSLKIAAALKYTPTQPKTAKLKTKTLSFKVDGTHTKKTTTGSKTTAPISSSQVINHANQVREQMNTTTHVHTRMMRHDVSILRSKMIKIDEEFRLASKSRALLESGLQEVRKSMSVNHQAISTHERRKKTSEVSLYFNMQ